ncbi:glycosyltransferase family 4 protein [Streptomyces sp. NPDC092296]|uniref:glycosyltransferase family 4 protein n=1 Tax=Streptomyces sp. NPDC092296 TaxID=3366012 RepID=UPI0038135558
MKISFLIHNAYGIGGTIRSTVNLSSALAERHEVEIVSVHRVADQPALHLDPRVSLVSLIDMRKDSPSYEGGRRLTKAPNTMFPDPGVDFGRLRYTGLHDERIAVHLARTDADVVIATRPILIGYLARYGQDRYLRIGQEHLTHDTHGDQLRTDQNAALAGLDAFVPVSEADAAVYRAALPELADRIVCVPNAVPTPLVEPSDGGSQLIVAAGRLVRVKRYDRLVEAFAKVAAQRPDWSLRIYGRGPKSGALGRRISELGLDDRARLMGAVSPIETEWAKGAIAAVTSDIESFGMTIVEAMHCGVPVVATDCPHGPGEIITHGADGLLVPLDGGTDAYADALLKLIDDRELRLRLGRAAREKAATYAPAAIASRYEQLIEDLRRRPRPSQGGNRFRLPLSTRLRASLHAALRRPGAWGTAWGAADDSAPPIKPLAYAAATADGGLTVRLDPATLPGHGPWDLVVRLRKDPEGREVRVPLPVGAPAEGQRIEATLPRAGHTLAEGRWDCYVAPTGSDRRRRIVAQLVEQARLLSLPPVVGPDGLSCWIPYATTDGYLAVRAWLRPAHAEVERVRVGETGAAVTARLLGTLALPAAGAVVTAVSREGEAYGFAAPVVPLGGDRFEFTLPYADALARRSVEQDLWDLRLVVDGTVVRIGRITGDVPDRKRTDTLPAVLRDHPGRGATRVRPFFTVSNDLALSLRDVPPPAPVEPAG